MTPADPPPEVIRSEERLEIVKEWRPGRRYRVLKRIVEKEMRVVERLRREELVIEEVPITAVERLETVTGLASPRDNPLEAPTELTIVLKEEKLIVEKQVVPYELVRINRPVVAREEILKESLRAEHIDIERARP